MIILHAGECEGSLFLWGEAPENGKNSVPDKASAGRPKSRMPLANTISHSAVSGRASANFPKMYPFGASSRKLSRALKDAVPDFALAADRKCDMIAWLPTAKSGPVSSSDILADAPAPGARTKLEPWTIPAYKLSMQQAVDLLCESADKRTLGEGVLVGADLAYWADAMRLAGSMVARQQFLPDLAADEDDRYRAVWNPVFVGKDAERLGVLAKRMPASGRALSTSSYKPPAQPAIAALWQIAAALTDYLVRFAHLSSKQPVRKSFDSVHDSWLYSLKSKKGTLKGSNDDLSELAEHVREWRRPISILANSDFRLCFRLEEPKDKDGVPKATGKWRINYLLQPHDDPSLLIPADEAWNKSRKASALGRSGSNIREFLLFSLGQASGICPGLAEGPGGSIAGHTVTAAKAYEFLTEVAGALEQAGYGVILPSWWTRAGAKAKLGARAKIKNPKMQAPGSLSLDTIFEFDWEVALGDQKVTITELEKLADLKSPLVRVRGQWIEADADEIKSAIKFLKKGTRKTALRDILMMDLGVKDTPAELEFEGIEASGTVADTLNRMSGKLELDDLTQPEGFEGALRPYQIRGYSWLSFLQQWGLGGCLADDMGLGKTVQVLALIQNHWQPDGGRPALIVCPTSVISNWRKEADRFTPQLPVMIHHGTGRKQGAAFAKDAKKYAIIITSYGLVHRDIKSIGGVDWSSVVLDEAQNIKNYDTKQSKAARSLDADCRFALTGTPVENNVGDLWSIMEFLNPSFLGTSKEFKRNFFIPIQAEQDSAASERLKRATGPFILRRLKTDKSVISDLPEKMEMKVYCNLTKEQSSLYGSVLKELDRALYSAEGIKRKGIIMAALIRLKQVCNHPAHLLADNSVIGSRSGKLSRLTAMLEEIIEVGDRALVFTQFVEMGQIIKRHVQETFGVDVMFLHGSVSRKNRDTMVERFQNGTAGPQIFVISLKAGGTGLNLTSANHVFHFDRWWNPAVEDQATDRAFRIGQKRNVHVYKFVCAGTLEEKIDEMIERKKSIAKSVVGTGEGWLTELSNDDLRDVLALSSEAAGA